MPSAKPLAATSWTDIAGIRVRLGVRVTRGRKVRSMSDGMKKQDPTMLY